VAAGSEWRIGERGAKAAPENRNPGAGPEGAEPGFRTRDAGGRGMLARTRQTVEDDAAFPATGGNVNRMARNDGPTS